MTGDGEGSRLIEFLEENFLHQIIDKPNRVRNVLVIIMGNILNIIKQTKEDESLSLRDLSGYVLG